MAELLLSCQDLSKAFGAAPLFEGLSFGVFDGDHVGLVGPNGSGKSTLLRILSGLEAPSAGTWAARKRLRVGYVAQDPGFPAGATVISILREAAHEDTVDEREIEGRVAMGLGKAGFTDPGVSVDTLSGGWKKRLAIARELARAPELLLLDEPTNHLDVDGILWLEELLVREPEAFVAVSHDRYFLEAVAGRVLELNRAFAQGVFDVRGRYHEYLQKKDELLEGQAAYQDSLRNRVRGEIAWLARKARARTRKAKARIDEAHRLQDELADLDERASSGAASIDFSGTHRKTKRLLVADGLKKGFAELPIVNQLDLVLSPGLRLGLLGPNGSGKTTLLRLLGGLEEPDAGTVERAPGLKVVTFDQNRSRLDPALSLRRTLAPAGDSVVYRDRAVHVAGLGEAVPLPLRAARHSGGASLGRRAGASAHRLPDAGAGGRAAPRRAHQRPRHPHPGGARREPPGFPRRAGARHPRPLPPGPRLHTHPGARRAGAAPPSTRTIRSGRRPARRRPRSPRRPGGRDRRRPRRGRPRRSGPVSPTTTSASGTRWRTASCDAEEELERCQREAADPAVASDHEALRERVAALEAAGAAVDELYARWAELEGKLEG